MSAAEPAAGRPDDALPAGFGVVFDDDAVWLDEATVRGGSPARVLRLSAAGARAADRLRAGPVDSPAAARLARRLTDAGLAHPAPPTLADRPDVTVVIPVKDRATALDRCLTALGCDYPVVVVDDGSSNAGAISEVAAAHGAARLHRASNGGPGAARNTGLAAVDTELVAFLDSDCVSGPDWIAALAAHLADPTVAAAAPRITPARDSSTALGRYSAAAGALDLGPRAALVAPLTRVAYVPTAALLVRRAAVLELTGPFDEALRVGEDVDLIWRLVAAGWRVRYDPSARVGHDEPMSWPALLARRYRYGTSAGPLARRHPAAMAPLVLGPGPAMAVAGVLGAAPLVAAAGVATAAVTTRRAWRRAGLPSGGAGPAIGVGLAQSWLGAGRYLTQLGLPVLVAASAVPRGRRRWWRRAAAVALVAAPALDRWRRQQPRLDPVRFGLAAVADDIAYGCGVWTGSLGAGTSAAVRPRLSGHPARPATRLANHPVRPLPTPPMLEESR